MHLSFTPPEFSPQCVIYFRASRSKYITLIVLIVPVTMPVEVPVLPLHSSAVLQTKHCIKNYECTIIYATIFRCHHIIQRNKFRISHGLWLGDSFYHIPPPTLLSICLLEHEGKRHESNQKLCTKCILQQIAGVLKLN